LNPQKNASHLRFYFDLYKWCDADEIGKIDTTGRVANFPRRFGPPGMVIVISGVSGTGRTSLENLLLFEIESRAHSPCVVTRYPVEISRNKIQAAHNFASLFVSDIGDHLVRLGRPKDSKALVLLLKDIIKEWRSNLVGDDPNADFLFLQLMQAAKKKLPDTPIVFSLDASNHMNTPDTWHPICTMLRNLADFVILLLSKGDHARFLRTGLRDSQARVVWIDVPRIDAEKARRFLAARLSGERTAPVAPASELFPFTDGAISALFAPTSEGEPVVLSIGVAIKHLKGVFEKKCADVARRQAGSPSPAEIADEELQITESDMRAFWTR
jgi:hypothetical protein